MIDARSDDAEPTVMPRDLQLALWRYTQARVELVNVIAETEDADWRNCIQRLLDLPITVRTSQQVNDEAERGELALST